MTTRCALSTFGLAVLACGAALADVPQPYTEFNGQPYHIVKIDDGDAEEHLYYNGAQWFTIQSLRDWVAAQPADKTSDELDQRLSDIWPDEVLDVHIVLSNQPAAQFSRAARARNFPDLNNLGWQMREISRRWLPTGSMRPEEEKAWTAVPMSAADRQALRLLAAERDALETMWRTELAADVTAAVQADQDAIADHVAALGGVVYARIPLANRVGALVAAGRIGELIADPMVAFIDLNHPGEPELDNHRQSLGLETGFWAAGVDGGVHDVGVLDTGVQQNHAAFSGHTFMTNAGASDSNGHGTGICGIMASGDALYRGMAFGCDKIVVAIAGDINTSMPGMNYIAGTGEPENVNYSFGNGTASGTDYTTTDQFFDGVISTFGYMVSKSTGNGGFGSGNPTITRPAPAYNLLASANMNDSNTIPRTDDRIDSTSSRGPTPGGRKKPDITAPGTNSFSTTRTLSFGNIGGTSSASPHTGGGVVLLWDMGNTSPMGAKAVLLNTTDAIIDNETSSTADDQFVAGSRWNRRYGWGYLNLGQAYLHGLNVFLDAVPDAPETADFRLYKGQMFVDERATLVWERHVAYNGAAFPTQIEEFSDLDLFAYNELNNALLASSASVIDNVEQLDVDVDAMVVLKVEAAGQFDPDITTEDFALATQENFVAASGPIFNPVLVAPFNVAPGQIFQLSFQVNNAGDLAAHGVNATLSGITILTGPATQALGSIAAGQAAAPTWTVQAPGVFGPVALSLAITSSAYGESFPGAGGGSIIVAPAGCAGDMDCDGQINFADIDPFVLALQGQAAYQAVYPNCNWLNGDFNENSAVDFGDIDAFVATIGSACP